MASITIRKLDDGVKHCLRLRAAENGRSMEEEARVIIRTAVGDKPPPEKLFTAIRKHIEPLGGVELDLPPREPMPDPPRFD